MFEQHADDERVCATFVKGSMSIFTLIHTKEDAQKLWGLHGFGKCPQHSEPSTIVRIYGQSKNENVESPFVTILSLEETIYLMKYYPNIFSLYSQDNELLGLEHIRACIESKLFKNKLFPYRFETYELLKQQGWIVKSGMKYGTDFLLYRDLPGKVHSDFAVVLICTGKHSHPELSYLSLVATCRTVEQVKKKLLLVIKEDLNKEVIVSISGASRQNGTRLIKIQRWDPQQTRQR